MFVMFMKKFSHESDEKLACKVDSKGWGNGLGNEGAVVGIVGNACAVIDVVVASGAVVEVAAMVVGNTILELFDAPTSGMGSGWRL
jgi:hypothetical protein